MSTPTKEQVAARLDALICYHEKACATTDEQRELAAEVRSLRDALSESQAYADKLAAGLPEGMLPADVDNLRRANGELAQQITAGEARNARLAAALEKLRPYLPSIVGNLGRDSREAESIVDAALAEAGPAPADIAQVRGGSDAPHTAADRPAHR